MKELQVATSTESAAYRAASGRISAKQDIARRMRSFEQAARQFGIPLLKYPGSQLFLVMEKAL